MAITICVLLLSVSLAVATTSKPSTPSPLSLLTTQRPSAGVGCAGVCCTGRDNSCRSTGLRLNGRGTLYSRCFCDEGCLDVGDCCFDYHTHCQAVNCQVSEWSEYSSCSKHCGVGVKTRERTIIVHPQFGGEPCPDNRSLREETVCLGDSCTETQVELTEEIEKETAKIMPASFGRFRNLVQYNANLDIRKNLFYRYYHQKTPSYSGYCSRFRVVSSSSNCRSYFSPWAAVLKKDAVICVECQQTAMEKERSNGVCAGHGEVNSNTNWNAINARGCTGWWQRLPDDQECGCSESNTFIFI